MWLISTCTEKVIRPLALSSISNVRQVLHADMLAAICAVCMWQTMTRARVGEALEPQQSPRIRMVQGKACHDEVALGDWDQEIGQDHIVQRRCESTEDGKGQQRVPNSGFVEDGGS